MSNFWFSNETNAPQTADISPGLYSAKFCFF